jgi:4-diphosphocytidyl-2-C-methyl-D-erythritol kinase
VDLSSPAKLNLSLKVGAVDWHGYHPVETVIHLLEFADTVTIEDAGQLRVTCSEDLGIPPQHNLVYRAAVAMGDAFGRDVPFHFHIDKRIPHAAGLGGGSSNAATVIAELARRWGIDPEDERIGAVARSLGADVAVFLAPSACCRLTGYGDRLAEALTARSGQPVVLVKAPEGCASTAEVYRMFDAIGPSKRDGAFVNDLADASRRVCPQTGQALDWLLEQPQVRAAQVCGSGAASFAIVDSVGDAYELADAARAQGFWSVATALR